MRFGKADLVERLLTAEKGYADMEHRWLRTGDEFFVWIMLVDHLLARRLEPDLPELSDRYTVREAGPPGARSG
jgi:hypothetical protein